MVQWRRRLHQIPETGLDLPQPAEEIFAGARSAIGEGVLENPQVDAAMVIHVDSTRATGNIAYGTQCNASVYGFKITLKGKGTHGAMPQDGIDPINAGVHLYLGLQELIARECNPCQDVVLTIGQFSAGNTANVIPNQTDSAYKRSDSGSQRNLPCSGGTGSIKRCSGAVHG